MSEVRLFLRWFGIGIAIGIFLVASQIPAVGGPSGMLSVGTESQLRQPIEEELGTVSLSRGAGHDGQITFAIATDLTGDRIPELLDHAGYRYRRIGHPALASGFGLLSGEALLWGMVSTNVLALGIASGGLAIILRLLGRSKWAQIGLLANPGVWLSVRLLTVDIMAISLSLAGVALLMKRRLWLATVMLSLAALTKDQYLLVAVAAGLMAARDQQWRRAVVLIGAPVLALATWGALISTNMDEVFSPRSNLSMPFSGIVDAAETWGQVPTSDLALSVMVIASIVIAFGLLALPRNRGHWMYLTPWLLLAIISSSWVWAFGNNVVRVFAPIIIWIGIGAAPNARQTDSTPAEIPRRR